MSDANRFDDFFDEDVYRAFKRHLYNYQLRKEAIARALPETADGTWLEFGCGTAPVSPCPASTVFTDLSPQALEMTRTMLPAGRFVVADCNALPFADNIFQRVICSEVLEHIPDDTVAIAETARVLSIGGEFIATYPRHSRYFTYDDTYVRHYRRYDDDEMEKRLAENGLQCRETRTVLGILDKAAMWSIVVIYAALSRLLPGTRTAAKAGQGRPRNRLMMKYCAALFGVLNRAWARIVRWEAHHTPASLRMVELSCSVKRIADSTARHCTHRD